MNQSKKKTFFIRMSIVGCWVFIFALFLLLPRVGDLFVGEQSISVLTWSQVIDAQLLQEFENRTGITVYLNYFDSNEELYAKLRFAGSSGYDLVIPSDFMVEQLIQDGLLKKFDRSKLPIFDHIEPELLGRYFDPNNDYSIPLLWDIYGLGINTQYFGGKIPQSSWALVFDERIASAHIGMPDDAREVGLIAARYLFGSIDNLDEKKVAAIERLLLDQKKRVEAYTDMRADYLLGIGSADVVLSSAASMIKAVREYPNLAFLVPENSFILIDSLVIPATSTKQDLVYQFINYLLDAPQAQHHFDLFGFLPSHSDTLANIDLHDIGLGKLRWEKLEFFRNVVPQSQLHRMWRRLKAA